MSEPVAAEALAEAVAGAAVLAAAPPAGAPAVVLAYLARVTPHLKERMRIM